MADNYCFMKVGFQVFFAPFQCSECLICLLKSFQDWAVFLALLIGLCTPKTPGEPLRLGQEWGPIHLAAPAIHPALSGWILGEASLTKGL